MCEQTPLEYKNGDIVWVKMGPCWWPGEVKDWDSVPPELSESYKKRPVAAVKFFQEDSYEIVKSINHIYLYNCKKKHEFIKKGLEMHRKENAFMKKFPDDVSTAEERTGGDPNIINSPMFAPEKKPNYTALIFGNSPKKSPKGDKKRKSSKSSPSHTVTSGSLARRSLPNITHPRFLGQDDHEVRILLQSPEENRSEDTSSLYSCTTCGFKTPRVDVIVLHNKSHIQGVYSTPISTSKKGKRSTVKKEKKERKMTHSKTSSIDEDLALLEKGLPLPVDSSDNDDDDVEEEPKVKKRRKVQSGEKSKRKKKKPGTKEDSKVDIRTDLLAEWEDEESDNNLDKSTESEKDKDEKDKKDENESEAEKLEESDEAKNEATGESSSAEINQQKGPNKSCFDFDEDDDEICDLVFGKIQRPSASEKQKKDEIKSVTEDEQSGTPKNNHVREKSVSPERRKSRDSEEIKNGNRQNSENVEFFDDIGQGRVFEQNSFENFEKEISKSLGSDHFGSFIDKDDSSPETSRVFERQEKVSKSPKMKFVQSEPSRSKQEQEIDREQELISKNVETEKCRRSPEKERSKSPAAEKSESPGKKLKVMESPEKEIHKSPERKLRHSERSLRSKVAAEVEPQKSEQNFDALQEKERLIPETFEKEKMKSSEIFDIPEQEEQSNTPEKGETFRKEPTKSPEKEKKPKRSERLRSRGNDQESQNPKKQRPQTPTFEEFQEILEATSVPALPEIPQTFKGEQNFPSAKMKKIPDKEEPSLLESSKNQSKGTTETATKHTNPKKRFVKTFEDSELNEKKKTEEAEKLKGSDGEKIEDKEADHVSKSSQEEILKMPSSDNCTGTKKDGEKENEGGTSEASKSTGRIEETKGLEVLKLKSQLMMKLTESNAGEKDLQGIVPKYKKFELKRMSPKRVSAAHKETVERKMEKKIPEKRFEATEKKMETVIPERKIEPKIKEKKIETESAVNVKNQDGNNSLPSVSRSTESTNFKMIEIIPKHHGEVGITVTKIENNNSMNDVSFRKYLYPRRQGRYSLKLKDRSQPEVKKDTIDATKVSSSSTSKEEQITPKEVKPLRIEDNIVAHPVIVEQKTVDNSTIIKKSTRSRRATSNKEKVENLLISELKDELVNDTATVNDKNVANEEQGTIAPKADSVANNSSQNDKKSIDDPDKHFINKENDAKSEENNVTVEESKLQNKQNTEVVLTENADKESKGKEEIFSEKPKDNLEEKMDENVEEDSRKKNEQNLEEKLQELYKENAKSLDGKVRENFDESQEELKNDIKKSNKKADSEEKDKAETVSHKKSRNRRHSRRSRHHKKNECKEPAEDKIEDDNFLSEENNEEKSKDVYDEKASSVAICDEPISQCIHNVKASPDIVDEKPSKDIYDTSENSSLDSKLQQKQEDPGTIGTNENNTFVDTGYEKTDPILEVERSINDTTDNNVEIDISKEEDAKGEEVPMEIDEQLSFTKKSNNIETYVPNLEVTERNDLEKSLPVSNIEEMVNQEFEKKDKENDACVNKGAQDVKTSEAEETVDKSTDIFATKSTEESVDEKQDVSGNDKENIVDKRTDVFATTSTEENVDKEQDVSGKDKENVLIQEPDDSASKLNNIEENNVKDTPDVIVESINDNSFLQNENVEIEELQNEVNVTSKEIVENTLKCEDSIAKFEEENLKLENIKETSDLPKETNDNLRDDETDKKATIRDFSQDFDVCENTCVVQEQIPEEQVIGNSQNVEVDTDIKTTVDNESVDAGENTDAKTDDMKAIHDSAGITPNTEINADVKTTNDSADICQSSNAQTEAKPVDSASVIEEICKDFEEDTVESIEKVLSETSASDIAKNEVINTTSDKEETNQKSDLQRDDGNNSEPAAKDLGDSKNSEKTDTLQSLDFKNDNLDKDPAKAVENRTVEETEKVIRSVFVTTRENEKDELSALSTLAAVSELSPPLEDQPNLEKITNLTVSETDLEDRQVEFVNAPESKPVTLTNFSVDFSESKEPEKVEKPKRKFHMESSNTEIPPEELPGATKEDLKKTNLPTSLSPRVKGDSSDPEENIPSLIICNKENSVQVRKIKESDQAMTSSKLLEILTDNSKSTSKSDMLLNEMPIVPPAPPKIQTNVSKHHLQENTMRTKFVVKSAMPDRRSSGAKLTKPVILSEKIIKPVSESETVSVQKVTSKRTHQDIEDIDTFIIQKPAKKIAASAVAVPAVETEISKPQISTGGPALKKTIITPKGGGRGKAKILQQTIITPAGDVIQPTVTQSQMEDSMFDINSMPIVLGDQILTPESIESLPVVITEASPSIPTKNPPEKVVVKKPAVQQPKILNKLPSSTTTAQPTIIRTYAAAQKLAKGQKNYQVASSKIIKSVSGTSNQPNKQGKFIIVPSSTVAGSSKTVMGKRPLLKQTSASLVLPASEVTEPVGNKIMIVTNQQGQQQRVLLTPAQQKMLAYQSPGAKLTKATIKSNIMAKTSKTGLPVIAPSTNSSNIITQTIVNSKSQIVSGTQNFITSGGQILVPITQTKQRLTKTDSSKLGKKIQIPTQKVRLQEASSPAKSVSSSQKTFVIKNQQGQIVKKIQGTDDALLEQQVQEQVQAIKASSSFSGLKNQNKTESPYKSVKTPVRRSYPKKLVTSDPAQKIVTTITTVQQEMPPLTPILSTSKKGETHVTPAKNDDINVEHPVAVSEEKPKEQRPLNQLIIQDALGNQTTITEGQILALPSETVDGQPQSYMLVTLDESGNLTPLNNEALLSLDPNLGIGGGDLSNMVLHFDERNTTASTVAVAPDKKEKLASDKPKTEPSKISEAQASKVPMQVSQTEQVPIAARPTETTASVPTLSMPPIEASQVGVEGNQTITCSVSTDTNQQLIISGDPISTQKFIESLSEGNADLANLLASAEGNILIHTDGQQILINTESESQLLLPVNAENVAAVESTEGGGNPIFATQSNKSQDILAAALADTDVFQQDQPTVQSKLPQSQLSPNSTLFPMNVGNVLETSLTLSSPIMTPLEVPSSNSKKIPDEETDILTTEVPKNVDLPITITDPNISQTVAQQQAATLMATELQNNLDLPLSIADQGVSVASSDMNSPSFVYSLPSLEETVEMNQKAFTGSISMPLLNEDTDVAQVKPDEHSAKLSGTNDKLNVEEKESDKMIEPPKEIDRSNSEDDKRPRSPVRSTFMSSIEGGLCTLGGEMCSSLSEPPPDMFDLSSSFLSSEEGKKDDKNIPESQTDTDGSMTHPLKAEENIQNSEAENNVNSQLLAEVTKRNNFLSETTVLGECSPVTNIDENSSEIPIQPQIVANLPENDSDGAENETSNSESPILDSSKRKAEDEFVLSDEKKSKFD